MVQVRYPLPAMTETEARRLALDFYGLRGTMTPLPSERDRNFHVTTDAGDEFVLKISNVADARAGLELQNRVLEHLGRRVPELATPRLVPTVTGDAIASVANATADAHFVRLLTFVPGTVWARVNPHSPELLHSLGRALGLVDAALQEVPPPAGLGELKWDLARAGWIREYLHHLAPERRARVERLFARYETHAAPRLKSLPAGLVYNDANDYNILVRDGRVTSLIDYGDMAHSPLVCDLAIGIAYAIMATPDPLAAAAHVVAGYHAARPLSEAELDALYPLVCARLCVSVTNSAYQRHAEPDNEYLLISERPAWAVLEKLEGISPEFAHYTFRAACGLPACPAAPALVAWIARHAADCGPIVDADLATESVVFDLSAGSTECGTLADMRDVDALSRRLFNRMRDVGARAGIGRYDEARLIYTGDLFATAGNDGPERRTVHLGLDVFMEAGSAVLAPLDGVVTSAVDNAGALDYGPTIILEHAPPDGPRFYTLYGHLSRESLRPLRAGQAVTKGQRIGTLGDVSVNGGWPPHLHFQIIADLLGRAGEFPGVAPAGQRAVWLSVSPDPNLLVGIPAGRFPRAGGHPTDLLTTRRDRLGRNLSLAYQKPLHIVRGFRQHLYDTDGRAYLDAVNNVAHVGHCHPRVVQAGQAQMAVLNTNSRYLHEHIVRFAERLGATLPDPLRVCFFVNSGSEACELALRLARTHTRSDATVVLDGAYHGNTASLVDVSPYKYAGPGGAGRPPFVRHIPMPDPYRGRYRRDDSRAGEKYGTEVQRAVEELRVADRPRPTFIAESLMGSSGQIVLPDGFLRAAYRHVHAAGGVCIADEVQVGFGRVGTHFWGFQTQGVVPDIVVLGKPIGNGHPIGAVVTTPIIAGSFHNGMEYFSTFGGNPVSCAIGLAVLDVIEDEGLQGHARRVGDRLRHGFEQLAERHALIGDVRGSGLFLGVEFVRDRVTLEPAAAQTAYVTRRLKERGILVSVDGPLHNVLKIKPPLVFDNADADIFVDTLDVIMREDGARA